ncbi:MAG: efflux RND transporter periplasmic adaptor subunit [Dysgonamonadaceae bacterium]|jgi:RND family efflux transporter MFP subunit|nr:efflux RND transporter periplasmic adaptor subunit [Dysgonamonadaceae bacterium]
MNIRNICLALICSAVVGCTSKKTEKEDEGGVQTVLLDRIAEVKAVRLEVREFNHELVSNGLISARNCANLNFKVQGEISEVFVKNGDRVRKGQKIACLDSFELQKSLEQAEDNLESARLNYLNELIGMGYSLADSSKISSDDRKMAAIKSGYKQSQNQFELAKYNYDNATLYAPFDGVIANLFSKPYNKPEGEQFCTVIDNVHLETDFRILENELSAVSVGDKVTVSPFSIADYSCEGRISEVNPVVDKNGMVRVKAAVNSADGKLYEGMNVKLLLKQAVGKQIAIPKSALVLRNNRKVVFKLQNETAIWVYVSTTLENAEEYVVIPNNTSELVVGDSVIYEGNINLAHETPVKLIQ